MDDITKQMNILLQGLPLKPLTTGYESLVLRKQNFQQYLQERFILEEDRKFLHESI